MQFDDQQWRFDTQQWELLRKQCGLVTADHDLIMQNQDSIIIETDLQYLILKDSVFTTWLSSTEILALYTNLLQPDNRQLFGLG